MKIKKRARSVKRLARARKPLPTVALPKTGSSPLAEVAVLEAELRRRYDHYKLSLCHENLNSEKAWNDVMAIANTLHSWRGQTATGANGRLSDGRTAT